MYMNLVNEYCSLNLQTLFTVFIESVHVGSWPA